MWIALTVSSSGAAEPHQSLMRAHEMVVVDLHGAIACERKLVWKVVQLGQKLRVWLASEHQTLHAWFLKPLDALVLLIVQPSEVCVCLHIAAVRVEQATNHRATALSEVPVHQAWQVLRR